MEGEYADLLNNTTAQLFTLFESGQARHVKIFLPLRQV